MKNLYLYLIKISNNRIYLTKLKLKNKRKKIDFFKNNIKIRKLKIILKMWKLYQNFYYL